MSAASFGRGSRPLANGIGVPAATIGFRASQRHVCHYNSISQAPFVFIRYTSDFVLFSRVLAKDGFL
jgi:hypothetical protein